MIIKDASMQRFVYADTIQKKATDWTEMTCNCSKNERDELLSALTIGMITYSDRFSGRAPNAGQARKSK